MPTYGMLARSPIIQPTLPLLAALNRLLASDRSFAVRIADMFVLLHDALDFHDGRLVCWLQGFDAGGLREQVVTPDAWSYPWNEGLTLQVARRGEPVRLVGAVRRVPDDVAQEGLVTITYCGVPIVWDGRTWGVLELRAVGDSGLSSLEQAFMGALLPLLAATIAVEGDSGRVRSMQPYAGEVTLRQGEVLTRFREELEAPLALNPLLRLLLRWALDSTGAEAGAISLIDHEHQEVVVQVYEGYVQDSQAVYDEPRRRWHWNVGVVGKVARSGQPLLLRNVALDPDYYPGSPNVRAELAVPFCFEGQVLAVLVLDSPRSAAFGEGELAFSQALCAYATQPLRRALRYQELLETSTQLGQVFSSMPSGLALLDSQGRILRHNPAWLTVWGLDSIDQDTAFFLPWDLVPPLLARLVDPLGLTDFCAVGQRNPTDVQTMLLLLREPHQEFQVLSLPTRDSLGHLTGRLWVVSDVTRERESDRLKSEFISVVSHELRTPLTSILGYTELLLARDFAPNEQRAFVKTVYDEASHLSQIVEDLLGFSRLEAGSVRLNQWVVSLRQLIGEMTAQLNIHLSSRHRLLIHLPNQLPPAYIDRDKVKQILFNLLTNAAKYSPRGGEISLSAEELTSLPDQHPPGRFLLLTVRDQGIGMSAEELPRIWERFYRIDNSNTRRIGGTGLGLSITKALVELHGGRIWAESVPGRGSAFFFTLPVATELIRR